MEMIDHYGGEDNPHEPKKIIKHYKLRFNLANVIKYVLRAGIKYPTYEGKIKDLEKAIDYLKDEIIELKEDKTIHVKCPSCYNNNLTFYYYDIKSKIYKCDICMTEFTILQKRIDE